MKHFLLLIGLGLLLAAACSKPASTPPPAPSSLPDTLRVGTLYSPASFFIYRGDSLGIDFTMARNLADSLHIPLKVVAKPSMQALIAALDSGQINLIAAPVPITSLTLPHIRPVGNERATRQVLVQRVHPGDTAEIADVTQLPGREVTVAANSKYEQRLRNLNDELGGGIRIVTVPADSLAPEDLVDMVASGKIDYTILDSDLANLHGAYHANLDTHLPVSLDQRVAWAVAPTDSLLAAKITANIETPAMQTAYLDLLKRYYQLEKLPSTTYGKIDFAKGRMSPGYDAIFRRYAPSINWDWRLLAAQAYTESNFNPQARSFAGARGLMQLMPSTGRTYGVSNPFSPEQSVRGAVNLLDDLNRQFAAKVPDPQERVKFVLASYNAGPGHIYDAMRLSRKLGLDPTKWDGNVARAVLMLANPVHFNDPVVKYGYLRGRETNDYVSRILDLYTLASLALPA